MKKSVRIHVEEVSEGPDRVRRIAKAEYFRNRRQVDASECYFEISGPDVARPLPVADWAVLTVLFKAMRQRRDIYIEGPVSKPFLDNLDEFQSAFSMWLPQLNAVDIIAQSEVISGFTSTSDDAVVAFSGGVDASFTAYRHIFKMPGQRHRNLRTAMLVHGFDIPLDRKEAFDTAVQTAERILEGTGVAIATVRTNLKPLLAYSWEQSFGAALAACLHQFSATHGTALVGSDEPYKDLVFPWGSNPVTNPLLGSDRLKVVTDGSGFTRTQKVEALASWPSARDNIRVCWEGPSTGRNCGRCEKCVRTILNFRAVGVPAPEAFPSDVSDEQVRSLRVRNDVQLQYLADIAKTACSKGMTGSWLTELIAVVERGVSA